MDLLKLSMLNFETQSERLELPSLFRATPDFKAGLLPIRVTLQIKPLAVPTVLKGV